MNRFSRVLKHSVPKKSLGFLLRESHPCWNELDRPWKREFFSNPFAAVTSQTDASVAQGFGSQKRHAERRLVPFTPEELYKVVVDVDQYKYFVPWCQSSKIISKPKPGLMTADLQVGFQMFSETYTSRIECVPGKLVKVEAIQSSLFNHLVNEWRFKPGPEPSSTWLDFLVDFQFRSSLYQSASGLFFDEVVKKMVEAFENRCMDIYSRTPRHTRHIGPSRRY